MKLKKPNKQVVLCIVMAIITVLSVITLVVSCDTLSTEFAGFADVEPTDEMLYGFGLAFTFGVFLFTGFSFGAFVESILDLWKGKVKRNEEKP